MWIGFYSLQTLPYSLPLLYWLKSEYWFPCTYSLFCSPKTTRTIGHCFLYCSFHLVLLYICYAPRSCHIDLGNCPTLSLFLLNHVFITTRAPWYFGFLLACYYQWIVFFWDMLKWLCFTSLYDSAYPTLSLSYTTFYVLHCILFVSPLEG